MTLDKVDKAIITVSVVTPLIWGLSMLAGAYTAEKRIQSVPVIIPKNLTHQKRVEIIVVPERAEKR